MKNLTFPMVVGVAVVYVASRAWGVKSWKGVSLVVLTVVAIPLVCYVLAVFTTGLILSLVFS